MTDLHPPALGSADDGPASRRLLLGAALLVGLFVVAGVVAHLPGVVVRAGNAAPLFAGWHPRVGIGTPLALAVAVLALGGRAQRVADSLRWTRLLAIAWLAGLVWMLSLALVDGPSGISAPPSASNEYLATARAIHDVSAFLHEFVSRIPLAAHGNWPTHVAGHPPGATLVFVALDRVGLGSGLASGLVICVAAATTPIAVAVACRAAGAEASVRRCLPFLVIGPSAVWQAVSADALFAAVAAWAVAVAALAARSTRPDRRAVLTVCSGALVGACILLSYGFALFVLIVGAAVLVIRGWSWPAVRLLGGIGLTALVVVALPSLWGFAYWEAYPVLRQRYWDGAAKHRPGWYWLWANLGILAVSAGPALGGGLAATLPRLRSAVLRPRSAPLVTLSVAAVAALLLADASLMSKAEVERIWLPFVPWALLVTALIPARWRTLAFTVQVLLALAVQHLLITPW